MNFKALFFLFFSISILGYSQEFSVSGIVADENGLSISFANVILMTQQDSTIVKGMSTDDNGQFRFNEVGKGAYILKISYIGYKEFLKDLSVDQNIDLGSITLLDETQNLDEVSIVFKKPTIKKEADRLVFNIENSALVEGNMLQALKNTPGVLVINNSLMVKNTPPTVYINNRKVNVSTSELTQLLENTSANAIKSIELITNPSAKYDASSGVVLNIVMSKNLVTGYRGNVFTNYTQGVFPRYNIGTSHFFKSEKINFYANYNYTDSKENRSDTENINYFDINQTINEFWESETNRNKWTETHNFNMNFDYSLDDKNTLSLSSNLLYLPYQKYIKSNITNVFDATRNLDFYYDSNNFEADKKHNLAFNFDYLHQFSKGELSINTHFTDYNYNQDQNIVSNYFDGDNTFLETTAFNTYNNQDTNIFTAQTDYNVLFDDSSTFETGIKNSNVKTNSDTSQYDVINGNEVLDVNNTNDFDYKENVLAAYVNYSKEWEKWSLILGLRAEQTNIKNFSLLSGDTNKQDYLKWFPTVSISYKPNDDFSVYSNYKRSIKRPYYQDLNPFRFYYNDNNLFEGNPNLKPELKDQIIVGTSFLKHFTFESYYTDQKDNIYVMPLQDNETNILSYTPLNFDSTVEYGFDFIINFYAAKDWSVYFLTSFYNIENQTNFGNIEVKQNQWSNYSILQNDLTFLKDRTLNVNFTMYYLGKNLQGFRVVEDRWFSSLSISKSIMQKRAVISLSVEDLFNAQDFNDATRYLNQYSSVYTNLDNRVIKFGFRYNFGNTILKTNSQTKDLDERERFKEHN